jgi:HEAT repeat protein
LLAEYKTSEVRDAVEPFLADVNESVRFHAAGTLFAIGLAESAEQLVDTVVREESLRIKNRIARGFEQAGWTLEETLAARLGPALPPGFAVRSGRVVSA